MAYVLINKILSISAVLFVFFKKSQEGSSQEGGENSQLAARVMNVEKHLVSLDEVPCSSVLLRFCWLIFSLVSLFHFDFFLEPGKSGM